MTREEAINEIKSWAIPSEKGREVLETLIPELRESEDERIRKDIIQFAKVRIAGGDIEAGPSKWEEWIAWLERQKDASKAIEAVDRIDKYIDENVANAHDMKDSNPDKQYYRGWDEALGEMAGILQDVYSGEKRKERKPILEVFGFKVGDAVRLTDGDGRKHIIKSFEKIEGLHGPDFYHVVFEDNTASDHIIPGDEYPNGYFTCMEKFEEKETRGKEMCKIEKIRQEIEAQIKSCKTKNGFPAGTNSAIRIEVYEKLLSFIDSLQQEQPEVDLEEEMDRFFEEMSIQEHENIFEDTYQMIARHFYELGLNAKKEE